MNGRRRIFAISITILGLAGGVAAGVAPASAATHAATSMVCIWKVNANGTDFFARPGEDIIGTLNNGNDIENPMPQTATHGSSTYEHGSRNGVAGWVRKARLDFQNCRVT
jgi:hypothetical protein